MLRNNTQRWSFALVISFRVLYRFLRNTLVILIWIKLQLIIFEILLILLLVIQTFLKFHHIIGDLFHFLNFLTLKLLEDQRFGNNLHLGFSSQLFHLFFLYFNCSARLPNIFYLIIQYTISFLSFWTLVATLYSSHVLLFELFFIYF